MFEEAVIKIYRNLDPDFLRDVNRLNQQTGVHKLHNIEEFGWEERLNQGYASVIDTYQLLHSHQIGNAANAALSRTSQMLVQNAEDEVKYRSQLRGITQADHTSVQSAHNAAEQHAEEKLSELYKNGEALIISGNLRHATIVRLRLDGQGGITCSTYNAGHEGVVINEKENICAVERHQQLRNPEKVKDLIVNHALKSVSEPDSKQHKEFSGKIEKLLALPHRWREGIGQGWNNCTARSPREFIAGVCQEAGQPELADGIRDLSVGGIEDTSYEPHQLHRKLSRSLDKVRNTSYGQLIDNVIEKNGGLVTGYKPDGTVDQVHNAYNVTEHGDKVTLDVYPPASPVMASAIEEKLRQAYGAEADSLMSRQGTSLTWDARITHRVAGSIQEYVGEKAMDSLRAETYQKQYGRGDDFTIQWTDNQMTATDKRDGTSRTYPKVDLDRHLFRDNPKPFMERLIADGANFKMTADRGTHFDAMSKVEMNGVQRNIVETMKYHGYLSENAQIGGIPRSVSITDKNPTLSTFARNFQVQHQWEKAKAKDSSLARLEALTNKENQQKCQALPVISTEEKKPQISDPRKDFCQVLPAIPREKPANNTRFDHPKIPDLKPDDCQMIRLSDLQGPPRTPADTKPTSPAGHSR